MIYFFKYRGVGWCGVCAFFGVVYQSIMGVILCVSVCVPGGWCLCLRVSVSATPSGLGCFGGCFLSGVGAEITPKNKKAPFFSVGFILSIHHAFLSRDINLFFLLFLGLVVSRNLFFFGLLLLLLRLNHNNNYLYIYFLYLYSMF